MKFVNKMFDSAKNSNDSKPRIKDIAKLAGVSPGTVDRVIHERGHVADDKRKKIEAIIKQQNYQPNPVARSLALKNELRIVACIPAFERGEYWHYIYTGIEKARKEMSAYKVMIDYIFFNQFDKNSFLNAAQAVLTTQPSAVIFAPVFIEESMQFARKMERKKIPFVLIDSNLEDVNSITYYGQHSRKSGYLVAKLLFDRLPEKTTILLTHSLRRGTQGSNQAVNREKGFMAYVEEQGLHKKYNLVRLDLHADNKEESHRNFQAIIRRNPRISGAVIFSSRVHRLLQIFEQLEVKGVRVIGYDELPRNVKALKNQEVAYLIAQRPEMQGYLCVKDLCKELIFRQKVHRVNYIPVDILTKENVDEYIQFNQRLNKQ